MTLHISLNYIPINSEEIMPLSSTTGYDPASHNSVFERAVLVREKLLLAFSSL